MSADHIIEDGEFDAYRVRIRFQWSDEQAGRWQRPSAAPGDYKTQDAAEVAALECWRLRGGDQHEKRDMDVEVIQVITQVRSVASVSPAAIRRRTGDES